MTRTNPELIAALGPLLDRALELEPDELEAWLGQLRLRQPDYAAELGRLLATEGGLDRQGLLNRDSGGEPDRQGFLNRNGGGEVDAPPTGLAGMQFGAWTLESRLGQGGMGSVWL